MKNKFLTCIVLLIGSLTFAQSPVGTWKTIDDETGKPKSIVKITEDKDGVLRGEVVKILTKGREDATCDKCEGSNKHKPIKGLTILWGLKKDGKQWEGGNILDPTNGKVYKSSLKMKGKDKIDVRGYVGISLIGRTQTWERVE